MTQISFDVPTAAAPDADDVRRVLRSERPYVLRGLTQFWKALDGWTLDYLEERAGHRVVPVEFYSERGWCGPWTTVSMTLSRYLQILRSPGEPEMCYLAQAKVEDYLPELLDDVPAPPALADVDAGAGIFLGRDSITTLHYHSRDLALLCQISGRKRVVLYAPDDHDKLDYHRLTSYRFNFSRIDFTDEAHRSHPGLARAVAYECVVEPGDCLFIPLYWGHLTRNEGLSASVTFFWRAPSHNWRPFPLALRSRTAFWFRNAVSEPAMHGLERVLGYT